MEWNSLKPRRSPGMWLSTWTMMNTAYYKTGSQSIRTWATSCREREGSENSVGRTRGVAKEGGVACGSFTTISWRTSSNG